MAITTTPPTTPQAPTTPPPPKPPGSRRPLIAITAVVILAALAAAGYAITKKGGRSGPSPTLNTQPPPAAGSPSPSSPTATSAPTDSTTTQQQGTEAAILAGYKTAEAILEEDASAYPANALDPRLAQHMTGAELRTVQNFLTVLRVQGRHGVGGADLTPRVTAASGSSGTITDCVFDHGRIVDGRTGQTISGPDTKTTLNTVTMVLDGGTWKVSDNQQVGTGCVQSA